MELLLVIVKAMTLQSNSEYDIMQSGRPYILFFENDPHDANDWGQPLRDAGFYVTLAAQVKDGLRELNNDVDIVITDLRMDHGDVFTEIETYGSRLTGLAVARKIRDQYPKLPIILISQARFAEAIEWCSHQSHAKFLTKLQILPSDLVKYVRIMLEIDSSIAADQINSLDLFISHSHRDEEIAQALVDLLKNSCLRPSSRIFCTSATGYKIRAGNVIDETIRGALYESKAFIGLITPASMKSTYVLFELGARWAAKLPFTPVLARGKRPESLPAPLSGLHVLNSCREDDVFQLIEEIADVLGTKLPNPTSYKTLLDRLVEKSKLPSP